MRDLCGKCASQDSWSHNGEHMTTSQSIKPTVCVERCRAQEEPAESPSNTPPPARPLTVPSTLASLTGLLCGSGVRPPLLLGDGPWTPRLQNASGAGDGTGIRGLGEGQPCVCGECLLKLSLSMPSASTGEECEESEVSGGSGRRAPRRRRAARAGTGGMKELNRSLCLRVGQESEPG